MLQKSMEDIQSNTLTTPNLWMLFQVNQEIRSHSWLIFFEGENSHERNLTKLKLNLVYFYVLQLTFGTQHILIFFCYVRDHDRSVVTLTWIRRGRQPGSKLEVQWSIVSRLLVWNNHYKSLFDTLLWLKSN